VFQVPFLELDADENVERHAGGKEQPAMGHVRRGPKDEDGPEIDGVADDGVQEWRMEFRRAGFGETEKFSVVDGNSGEENQLEAEGPDDVEADGDHAIVVPRDGRHGLPKAGDDD